MSGNSQAPSSEQPGTTDGDGDPTGNDGGGRNAFLAVLGREAAAADGDGDDGEHGESRANAKPETLEALAKAVGVQVSDLYSIKVPASGGREAMTIGQIKDRFSEFDALEADRLTFSEQKVQQEQELQRLRDEFREILAVIPKEQLKPELLQRAAERLAARDKARRDQIVVALPEWKDDATRKADMAEITKMLAGYGLNQFEVQAINDPRLLKFARDAQRREALVRKALESVKKVPKREPQQRQAGGGPAPRKPAAEGQRQSLRPVDPRERFREVLDNHR
jgi:hypothetical protein